MASKLRDYGNGVFMFWCPACQTEHPFNVPKWSFNGDMEKPTFEPSLRVFGREAGERTTACHLFVRDGMIEYCGDCPHELAGKTVPMEDFDPEHPW